MKQVLFCLAFLASFSFDANAQITRYHKFVGDLPNIQEFNGGHRRTVNPDLYVWVDVPTQPGNYAEETCKECLREAIIATGASAIISAVYSAGSASMATASATFQSVLTNCIRTKLRMACGYGGYVQNEYGAWHNIATPGPAITEAPEKAAKEAERTAERVGKEAGRAAKKVEKILGW